MLEVSLTTAASEPTSDSSVGGEAEKRGDDVVEVSATGSPAPSSFAASCDGGMRGAASACGR
jgi:hypothetical protein